MTTTAAPRHTAPSAPSAPSAAARRATSCPARQPEQTRRAHTYAHIDRWNAALDDFTVTMSRAQLAPSTLARVAKHLHRFAADTDTRPYDVTAAQVTAWLDAQTCTAPALSAYRTSLRTFYRWAVRVGRMFDDPTATSGPHPLTRPTPPGWHDALVSFRRWLRAASYSPATADLYYSRLSALARETGAPTPWALSADDLADWLAGHHWARETLRANRTCLRTFYRWAHDLGHIDRDPAERLPKVRATAPRPRPASEDAYRHALAAADDRTGLMLRLGAELGLRRGEVAQVHAADLELDHHGAWWLHVHGKGDKHRRLPVPPGLAAQIRAAGPGYVFPGQINGHLSPRRVGELVSALLPPGVTMHALRHRFATRVYAVDRDVFTVQQLLGHVRADTTQRYVQTDDAAMRRLVDHLAAT